MPMAFRLLILTLTVILVVLAISVLVGNDLSGAANRLIPGLPLITLLPSNGISVSDLSAGPSDRALPAYVVAVPSFTGRVLHWTEIDYRYSPRSPDPANGLPLKVDTWTKVGADGVPTTSRATSTYADNTFHQEVLQTSDSPTIIFGAGYPDNALSGTRSCRQRWPSYTTEMRRNLLPRFVNEALLPRFGFNKGSEPIMQLPSIISLSGIKPTVTYESDTTAQTWESRQVANGLTRIDTLVVVADGRVVLARTRLMNGKNQVTQETQFANGPLEVYDGASVPSQILVTSKQAAEACHE